jgi:phenylacetate-CoA ligase
VTDWPPASAVRLPGPGERYWSPIETAAPSEREAVIVARLQRQLEYAWEHSPFYRRVWGEAGVEPDALKTLADLRRFPFVTKDELRADQEEHPPFGSNLCCSPDDVTRIHGTSGTTGMPIVFGISEGDWQRIGAAHARIMWSFGIRPSDTVFIASYFSLYLGSWGALAGTTALGARAFPFGAGAPGQTERALAYLRLLEPDAFYGTPSYALHLAGAAAAQGVDPSSLGFRVMFFSGEPGAGIPATKRRLEETFGAIAVDTGSMAEMTPWMSNAECAERQGMHLWDDVVYTEIVDPETHDPIDEGEGVPVYTHLDRTSQPMIRLFSGDLAQVTSAPCTCGRTYRRLPAGVYGRVDDMLVIRGVNVYPHALEDAIRRVDGVGHEYRVVIDRPDQLDVLNVEVEGEDQRLAVAIRDAVKLATGITPVVELRSFGSLPTTEFKSRRISDRRTSPQPAATTRGK